MFDVKPDDFKIDYSDYDFHVGFHGVAGDKCGKCDATVNIGIPGPGWICVCGHYNVMSWSHNRMLYVNPTYGYGRDHIQKMMKPVWARYEKAIARGREQRLLVADTNRLSESVGRSDKPRRNSDIQFISV